MNRGAGGPTRLAAVSVDLDAIRHYRSLYGLSPSGAAHQAHDVALPRLAEFASDAGIPLTLFVVGEDLERRETAAAIRTLASEGHEIASHSHRHRYDLTRLDRGAQRDDVLSAAEAIERLVGERPVGFRAPGYTMTDTLCDVLEDAGVEYDSSVFPCPPYWALKASKLALLALAGRSSRSILDHPRVLAAPRGPYRIGRPYWRRGGGLLELPIQVAGPLRLPYIGTTLTLLGPRGAAALTRWVVGAPLVNLELHAIDLLDRDDDLQELARHQADLGVPVARKRAALRAAVEVLREAGHRFVTLRQAARELSPALP